MGTGPTKASASAESARSPKQQSSNSSSNGNGKPKAAPTRQDSIIPDATKTQDPAGASNAEASRPLAPPPKPASQQPQPPQPAPSGQTPDYFSSQLPGSLSLEPNPFEQSFGGQPPPDTPGGTTKLPSLAALTSPSALLPGAGTTPFNWAGGSLRTGPLSPAMLSGPASTDYFSDAHHFKGGFTPNESSLRTGLTPGGGGSMFPAQSPNSALFGPLGGVTPNTIDFHRTALSAAAKRDVSAPPTHPPPPPPPPSAPLPPPQQQHPPQHPPQPQPQSQTQPRSQPQQGQGQGPQQLPPPPPPPQAATASEVPLPGGGPAMVKSESKAASGPFDNHDNDAASGLYMLAQGAQTRNPQPLPPPPPQTKFAPAPVEIPALPLNISRTGSQPVKTTTSTSTSPRIATVNGGGSVGPGGARSARGASEAGSPNSDDSERAKQPITAAKGKGKRNSQATPTAATATASGRRKAEDQPAAKAPASKKARTNSAPSINDHDMGSDDLSDDDLGPGGKDDEGGIGKSKMTEDEKRKNFLERNRIAALKCRQRKKQWLQNLQSKVEIYTNENDALSAQIASLREEVVNLKTLLLAHKDCPVTQQQGIHGAFMAGGSLEPYPPQMAAAAYSMAAAPMPNQPAVIAGQGVSRRYS